MRSRDGDARDAADGGQRGAASRALLLGLTGGTALVLTVIMLLLRGDPPSDDRRDAPAPGTGEAARPVMPRPAGPAPLQPPAGPPAADAVALELPPELAAESAELLLRLYDSATQEPVASEVELWPLALMETGAGAPVPRRAEVPPEGLRFPGLGPGLYRAHIRTRRRSAEDPPEFLVAAPKTEVRLPVDLGQRLLAVMEIHDEAGQPVAMANLASGWLGQPAVHDPFGLLGEPQPRDDRRFDFGSRHVSMQDGQFRLGTVMDLDCDTGGSPWWELTARERSPVRAELAGYELLSETFALPPEGLLRLVGVALPEGFFDDAVRMPDGRRAVDHGGAIEMNCRALPRAADDERPWLSVPIEVRAELDGHEPLVFHYTLAEGEPARRELVPKER